MSSSSGSDEGYEAPRVLTVLQKVFAATRAEYSTDLASVFDEDNESNYRAGLVFLSCILGGILFIWMFLLLSFKCKGVDSVGCAAGGAFRHEKENSKEENDTGDSTGPESHESGQDGSKQKDVDEASFHSSIPSEEDHSSIDGASTNGDQSIFSTTPRPSRREKRTQIAFFLFGLITLAGIPLALIFSIGPMRDVAAASLDHVEDARQLVGQVETSVGTISEGIQSSMAIVDNLPLKQQEVCPEGNRNGILKVLGFDIDSVIGLYALRYSIIESQVVEQVEEFEGLLNEFSSSLDLIETSANETENYIWILPGLLMALGTLSAIILFGVFVSWKRNSNHKFQRFLSYGILPCFIVVTLLIWVVAIGAASAAAVGADGCTSGSSNGSPAIAIESILEERDIGPDSMIYKFFSAYSHESCDGSTPAQVLYEYESDVQGIVETIWEYLAAIDSAGRSNVRYVCGDNNELSVFLEGLQDLAKQLTVVRKALDSAGSSLACSRIHPIYQEAIEQSLCTDATTAIAWGFVIFFSLGLTTMSMITLRSSWRQTIPEDKIYDESEVAENMIFDEHEEYLAYISKYKHEWEEYEGVGTAVVQQSTSIANSESEVSEIPHDDDSDDSSTCHRDIEIPVPSATRHEPFDPYNSDGRSQSTSESEDISFLSLSDVRTPDSSPEARKNAGVILPSPLLQQNNSLETMEDTDSLVPPMPSDEKARTVPPMPSDEKGRTVPGESARTSKSNHKITSSNRKARTPVKSDETSVDKQNQTGNTNHITSTTGEPFLLSPPIRSGSIVSQKFDRTDQPEEKP